MAGRDFGQLGLPVVELNLLSEIDEFSLVPGTHSHEMNVEVETNTRDTVYVVVRVDICQSSPCDDNPPPDLEWKVIRWFTPVADEGKETEKTNPSLLKQAECLFEVTWCSTPKIVYIQLSCRFHILFQYSGLSETQPLISLFGPPDLYKISRYIDLSVCNLGSVRFYLECC